MTERRWSPEVQALGDRVAALTAAKAVELGKYLEAVHGVKAVAPVVIRKEETEEREQTRVEPTEFKVLLDGFDATRKLAVVRLVRELLGVGVKEAMDLVQAAPRVIREGLPREEAEQLRRRLEEAGARAVIE
jgi:large subunit ribosomal protein L7/L12